LVNCPLRAMAPARAVASAAGAAAKRARNSVKVAKGMVMKQVFR
jgi:hypothetical protein